MEDFICDEHFRAWVLSAPPEAEANEFWQSFLKRYPERSPVLAAAQSLFLTLHESQSVPSDEQGRRMWAIINEETANLAYPESEGMLPLIPRNTFALWRWLSVAAIGLVVLGVGWLALGNGEKDPASYAGQIANTRVPLTERTNDSDKNQAVQFSDGSQVVLFPGSRLSFKRPFTGGKREVFLSGKGYFEVVKDDARPFIVFANNLVTQVVGTSFTIDAFAGDTSPSVEVKTGKVKVFTLAKFRDLERGQPEEMVELTANQQVRYDASKKVFATSYVPKPDLLSTPQNHPDFNFRNTAVADVFQTLEDSYGVKIEFNQENLKNCNITAPLGDEPLFRKLDIICQTIGATYEVFGTRIVVSGSGCSI